MFCCYFLLDFIGIRIRHIQKINHQLCVSHLVAFYQVIQEILKTK